MSDRMFGLLMLPIALAAIAWVLRARVRNLIWWLHAVRHAVEQERSKLHHRGKDGKGRR